MTVRRSPNKKKWQAYTMIDKHNVYVGTFKTRKAAQEAIEDAKAHNHYTFYEGDLDPLNDNIKPGMWNKIKQFFVKTGGEK